MIIHNTRESTGNGGPTLLQLDQEKKHGYRSSNPTTFEDHHLTIRNMLKDMFARREGQPQKLKMQAIN